MALVRTVVMVLAKYINGISNDGGASFLQQWWQWQ